MSTLLSQAGFSLRPSTVNALERDAKTPSTYQWSLGVQQEIGWGMVADVTYVGWVGRHMSLADDWGPRGVTVNCLAPGWFKTAQNARMYEDQEWVEMLKSRIPLRRPGQPDDLDGAVVFLASEESRYVTAQTLLVDGGISGGAVRALPRKA